MDQRAHGYAVHLQWIGARARGTTGYTDYGRDHVVSAAGKPDLAGSADAAFRGDATRWSPEDLLLAALSACHQLAYLHLCASAGVAVLAYADDAEAEMREQAGGGGRFVSATLRPMVTISEGSDTALAESLHAEAARRCFIARSVNFPVHHAPSILRHPG